MGMGAAGDDNENDDGDDDADDKYLADLEREARLGNYGKEFVESDEDGSEDEVGEGESDSDSGRALLSTQKARNQIFPLLLDVLCNDMFIQEKDRTKLLDLFASNNPVLKNALDTYELNNDIGSLVDTLQQLALRAV